MMRRWWIGPKPDNFFLSFFLLFGVRLSLSSLSLSLLSHSPLGIRVESKKATESLDVFRLRLVTQVVLANNRHYTNCCKFYYWFCILRTIDRFFFLFIEVCYVCGEWVCFRLPVLFARLQLTQSTRAIGQSN